MMPMPRKARAASAATRLGSSSETETTMGAVRLGSSSRSMIRRVGIPMTREAWMNSRSRSESTSPRIRRAMGIHVKKVRTPMRAQNWTVP